MKNLYVFSRKGEKIHHGKLHEKEADYIFRIFQTEYLLKNYEITKNGIKMSENEIKEKGKAQKLLPYF